MFKRVLEVQTQWFCGCELVNLVDLMNLERFSFVGGSASPFIDKGDDFTGERERVQTFLSLAAYGDENWIMVEAPQYCRCRCRMSNVHGRSSYLFQKG